MAIKKGAKGSKVKAIQADLNRVGAKPKLKLDGNFNDEMEQAIRHYQKTLGMKVDGKLTFDVLNCLDMGMTKPVAWTIKPQSKGLAELEEIRATEMNAFWDAEKVFEQHKKDKDVKFGFRSYKAAYDPFMKAVEEMIDLLASIVQHEKDFKTTYKGFPNAQAGCLEDAEKMYKEAKGLNARALKKHEQVEAYKSLFEAMVREAA